MIQLDIIYSFYSSIIIIRFRLHLNTDNLKYYSFETRLQLKQKNLNPLYFFVLQAFHHPKAHPI